MTLPFFVAKARVPNFAPNLAHHLCLGRAINQCLQPGRQLTLTSAPAGFAKIDRNLGDDK